MNTDPVYKRLYRGWMAIVGRFGHVQTLVILAVFYAFLIGPFAIASTLGRSDFLSKRGLFQSGSAWQKADSAEPSLERAKLTT